MMKVLAVSLGILIIFSLVGFSSINAEILGNKPKPDDKIIILQHHAVEYPRFVNEKMYMSAASSGAPVRGNEPFFIEGIITNISDQVLEKIIIKARYYEGGEMRDEVSEIPLQSILRPGDFSIFYIYAPIAFLDCYDIWIESYDSSSSDKVKEVLELVDESIDKSKIDFDTTVKNNGDRTVEVFVLVASYDKDYNLKSFVFAEPETILPGKKKEFKHVTDDDIRVVVNEQYLNFLKGEHYETIAIAYDVDKSYSGAGTKSDRWYPLHALYLNDQSNSTVSDALSNTVTKNDPSSCTDEPVKTSDTSQIPSWIHMNAKWWSEGSIGDSDFVSGIEYLIKQEIIVIPDSPKQTSDSQETKIPDWIRNNAKWWSEGKITDDDFVKGLQYLIQHGIIQV